MTHEVETRAAIDLGSNSFHLLIQETDAIRTVTVERMKQKVQLALGVESAMMTQDAIKRGLECLARFAQRLAAVDCRNIEIAGTCALRNARNSGVFIEQAEDILGCSIRIVTGEEEANLIYLGALHQILPVTGSKLVIDIGGGSTEFALGDAAEAKHTHSFDVGCVELMDRFYRHGGGVGGAGVDKPGENTSAFVDARDHAIKMFAGLNLTGLDTRHVEILGTSGTIDSIQKVLAASGWGSGEISASGLNKLEAGLKNNRWPTGGSIPGLEPERVDIFPAGVAILCAVFRLLNIDRMRYLDASLLDGLIIAAQMEEGISLVGDNLCEKSVAGLMRRYAVDEHQVTRVSLTLGRLWEAVADNWGLMQNDSKRLLNWSAQLHEIGIQIAVRHYHRHGSYIIKHSEIAGLSHRMRTELALLVRNHRRGFKEVAFSAFAPGDENRLMKLSILLRIAVILERSRNDDDSPTITISSTHNSIGIEFESDWLVNHALSKAELVTEQSQLARLNIKLQCF